MTSEPSKPANSPAIQRAAASVPGACTFLRPRIGLVSAAQLDSGRVTTYTYDPSGNPTVSGTTNVFWPFLYHGMEQEFLDAPYYYTGSGQFYSPQMVRSLSETGQTSSSGAGGGPSGHGGGGGGGGGSNPFLPSYNPFPTSGSQLAGDLQFEAESAAAGLVAGVAYSASAYLYGLLAFGKATIELPPAWIVDVGIGLFELFDELFGGGSDNPPTPRQLRHGRHPLYPVILGIQDGLIPDETSAGPEQTCGDLQICPIQPLAQNNVTEIPQQATPTQTPIPWDRIEQDIATLRANGEDSAEIEQYLEHEDGLPSRSLILSHCLAPMFPTIIRRTLRPGLGLYCPSEFMDDA